MPKPYLSVVVPVYNEADNLEALCARLITVLDNFGKPYEIILINDGSSDGTESILNSLYQNNNILRIFLLKMKEEII